MQEEVPEMFTSFIARALEQNSSGHDIQRLIEEGRYHLIEGGE